LAKRFRVILLRGKLPVSRAGRHYITTDPREIEQHRGNVGVMAGRFVGLDFDNPEVMAEMMTALGPLTPTVQTGSGKYHCYLAKPDVDLPRYFFWKEKRGGEIARLESEYLVAPPSIHPETGRPYRWLVDPRESFPALPARWREHLLTNARVTLRSSLGDRPAFIPEGDTSGAEFEVTTWDGPPAEELVARALQQPGARRRHFGIKFQCPGCRAEGHDKHEDNATVFNDGRWGCAYDSNHSRAISEVLGVIAPSPVEGFNSGTLRAFGMRL
jgi:hypothetical protein